MAVLLAASALALAAAAPAGAEVFSAANPTPFPLPGNGTQSLDRDCGLSTKLLDGNSFWAFCDTATTSNIYTGGPAGFHFFPNSAAIALASAPTTMKDHFSNFFGEQLLNNNQTFLTLPASATFPCSGVRKAWPRTMVNAPTAAAPTMNHILIWYVRVCDGGGGAYSFFGSGLAAFDPQPVTDYDTTTGTPTHPLTATVLQDAIWGDSAADSAYMLGASLDADGYVYLHRCSGTPKTCSLARVLPDHATTQADYTFWRDCTGVTPPCLSWNTSASLASAVLSGSHLPLGLISVQKDPQISAYVMTYTECTSTPLCNEFDHLVVRTAPAITGPWLTLTSVTLPGCSAGQSSGCYAGSAHAEITQPGALTLTWAALPSTHLSSGTVPLRAISHNAEGVFESAAQVGTASPGTVQLTGWAVDPDAPGSAVTVKYKVGASAWSSGTPANVSRPLLGLPAQIPGAGDNHGFQITVPNLAMGAQTICVKVVNQGAGDAETPLGCRSLTLTTLPSAPTIGNAYPGATGGTATVNWSAPASDGGLPITGYRIQVVGGAATDVGVATTGSISGLTVGQTATFTVAAKNANGIGPASAATNGVLVQPPGQLHPVTPTRILDSHSPAVGGWTGPLGQTAVSLDVNAAGSPVPATVSAVALNVTVSGGTAFSRLQVFPHGSPMATGTNPTTAVIFSASQTVSTTVIVGVDAAGLVDFWNATGTVHVSADVTGYFDTTSSPGGRFTAVAPKRFVDSTTGVGWTGPLTAGTNRDLVVANVAPVAWTAKAVALNVTVSGGTAASTVSVFPTGQPPVGSAGSVVFGSAQTIANLVVVGVGTAGKVTFQNATGSVALTADVVGYFDGDVTGGVFHPIVPVRIVDSRNGTGTTGMWQAGEARSVSATNKLGIPAGASGVAVSLMAVGGSTTSSLQLYSADPAKAPTTPTSSLSFLANGTVTNADVVGVDATGQFVVKNQAGTVHVVVDVLGYYASS